MRVLSPRDLHEVAFGVRFFPLVSGGVAGILFEQPILCVCAHEFGFLAS